MGNIHGKSEEWSESTIHSGSVLSINNMALYMENMINAKENIPMDTILYKNQLKAKSIISAV